LVVEPLVLPLLDLTLVGLRRLDLLLLQPFRIEPCFVALIELLGLDPLLFDPVRFALGIRLFVLDPASLDPFRLALIVELFVLRLLRLALLDLILHQALNVLQIRLKQIVLLLQGVLLGSPDVGVSLQRGVYQLGALLGLETFRQVRLDLISLCRIERVLCPLGLQSFCQVVEHVGGRPQRAIGLRESVVSRLRRLLLFELRSLELRPCQLAALELDSFHQLPRVVG
jgi:hypothetical protein